MAAAHAGAIRVVVVDEHPIVRRGIAALLEERSEFRLCGEADGLPGAIKLVRDLHPHLVLVELTLQDGSGLELIKELSSIDPAVRVCVFSMHDEALFAERALRAGARGFLSKRAPLREVLSALRRILDGRVYLSDQMTDRMLSRAVGGNGDPIERSPIETLSDRELEVFEQVGRGVTTRQIAEQLFLSPKTVETYRENIKVKLNLHNATELTQHAVKWVLEKSGAIANGG
jgi:DNA-binding NarL/FixJ family response regulator